MAVQIVLGSENSDPRSLSRSFASKITTTADVYDAKTITSPAFELDYNAAILSCNYMQAFGRGYYITDIALDKAHKMIVRGRVDVMGTYADNIRNLTALVSRQESHRSAMLTDGKYPVAASYLPYYYTLPNNVLTGYGSTNTYVIALVGGSS